MVMILPDVEAWWDLLERHASRDVIRRPWLWVAPWHSQDVKATGTPATGTVKTSDDRSPGEDGSQDRLC